MKPISHPMVAASEGGGACPEEYVGTLTDGRHFYFRYRRGRARLGLGSTEEDAVRAERVVETRYGNRMQCQFECYQTRDDIFAGLLNRALVDRVPEDPEFEDWLREANKAMPASLEGAYDAEEQLQRVKDRAATVAKLERPTDTDPCASP